MTHPPARVPPSCHLGCGRRGGQSRGGSRGDPGTRAPPAPGPGAAAGASALCSAPGGRRPRAGRGPRARRPPRRLLFAPPTPRPLLRPHFLQSKHFQKHFFILQAPEQIQPPVQPDLACETRGKGAASGIGDPQGPHRLPCPCRARLSAPSALPSL